MNLLSTPTYVESPFIIMKVGDYTFGKYTRTGVGATYSVTFPNYMKSIRIVKVNGSVNTYTINLVYGITQYDDPNKLDMVFSTISEGRRITLSYGDWNAPSFIYREETAIITKITSSMSMSTSQISYTISATSDSLYLTASRKDFPKRFAKPSTVIYELLENSNYGLLDIFTGMRDISFVKSSGLIPTDVKEVTIEAKTNISILEYLNYLVGCMVPSNADEKDGLMNATHYLHIVDDDKNKFGGTYFEITRVYSNTLTYDPSTTYEVDVGYPKNDLVTAFSVNSDDSWSILYNYANDVNGVETVYTINNQGQVIGTAQPDLAKSNTLQVATQANKNWWAKVTQFPISATLTIKGLLRPAILMSQVHVNVLFYGKKHISSGLYIITKHEDIIDSSGYRTTLSLVRIGGDKV